jgi:phenylalanyl-tRNA synthetase beta chain
VDVTREADVIEEILRIYGYNNIELREEIKASISYTANPDPEKVQNKISGFLAANGFNEIMNNSLSRSNYYEGNADFPVEKSVRMLNPISRDLDVMRQTLLYGALESVVYNQNRKMPDLKMFEFGRVYSIGTSDLDPLHGYHEEKHLALVMSGRSQAENWNASDITVDFYALKGVVETIFSTLSVPAGSINISAYQSGVIGEGLKYDINGFELAVLGSLSGKVLKSFDCRLPVFYAEINWDVLFSMIPNKNLKYREIPKFPEVRRDLALVVGSEITFEQIQTLAFQTEKKLLKKVGLFDVYEGDKISAGKKSYAMSFILQSDDKTLTDKEIEKSMEKLLKGFADVLDAQLR